MNCNDFGFSLPSGEMSEGQRGGLLFSSATTNQGSFLKEKPACRVRARTFWQAGN